MEIKSYPHVAINTTALKRSSRRPAAEDTTVLFAPFFSDRGPADRIVACHSLSEFIGIFGELSYEKCGQQALNIYNWLSNGGTVYARRLNVLSITTTTGQNASTTISQLTTAKFQKAVAGENSSTVNKTLFEAKYPGLWYNKLVVNFTLTNTIPAVTEGTGNSMTVITPAKYIFTVTVTHSEDKTVRETFYKVTKENYNALLSASEYIKVGSDFSFDLAELTASQEFKVTLNATEPETMTSSPISALNTAIATYFNDQTAGRKENAINELGNHLETPVDLILDAGFAMATKEAIATFRKASREDIICIFDNYDAVNVSNKYPFDTYDDSTNKKFTNDHTAVYEQTITIYDAILTDKNITVGSTYFLSKLIPFNDLHYGIQLPTAGLRRGILEDALAVSYNPTPSAKESLFKKRVNYIEKTSREYAFMSQRTHDGSTDDEYTALSFLNNVRCVERMKKDIERLARGYLFEFNDSVTLSQLSNILNKYIGEWISNRTLSYGIVEVSQDEYSTERVNVSINMRFTGTIEIIAVDIVIE